MLPLPEKRIHSDLHQFLLCDGLHCKSYSYLWQYCISQHASNFHFSTGKFVLDRSL